MKQIIAFALTLMLAIPVAAQEAEPPPIRVLRLGEPAPFAGRLFPTETAVRWRLRIESLEEQLDAEVDRATETCTIRTNMLGEQLRLLEERRLDETTFLREEIRKARERSWWGHPAIWAVVGAAVVAVPMTVQAFR